MSEKHPFFNPVVHPAAETVPPPETVREQSVEFVSGGQKVRGALYFPERMGSKNPALLLIHGWRGDQTGRAEIARAASARGFVCLTFDLRGHGTSEGDLAALRVEDFMGDVTTAYDLLSKASGVDPKRISVGGNSFGSYLAARLVGVRDVENLALQAPANYPDDVIDRPVMDYSGTRPVSEWRQAPLASDATSSLDAVHGFRGKILVIESERDEFVPRQTTQNYLDAASNPAAVEHEVLLGASHTLRDPELRKQCKDILLAFLAKNAG